MELWPPSCGGGSTGPCRTQGDSPPEQLSARALRELAEVPAHMQALGWEVAHVMAMQGTTMAALEGLQQDMNSKLDMILGLVGKVGPFDRVQPAACLPCEAPQPESDVDDADQDQPMATTRSAMRESGESLPPAWPASVPRRSGLQGAAPEGLGSTSAMTISSGRDRPRNRRLSIHGKKGFACSKAWGPHSPPAMVIELMGFVVLMYDLLVTPFVFAWEVTMSGPLNILSCASAAYWTCYIVANFKIGFYSHGDLKVSQAEVAWNYLTGRFFLDLALVCVDWVNIALQGITASTALRILKVLRLAKLLRVLSIMKMLDRIFIHARGEVHGMIAFVKISMFTMFSTHLLCCTWYAIGTWADSDTGFRWFGKGFREQSALYTYLTSYHWALAQVTLGGTELAPTNSWERMFCILLMIFGLLFSSTVVAVISMHATEWVTLRRAQIHSLATLDRFLSQSPLDTELATRVRKQAAERMLTDSQPLLEENVLALSTLSSDLRSELLRKNRLTHLVPHHLFGLWADLDIAALHDLCDEAVKFKAFAPQDCAFLPATAALEALYVIKGQMLYYQDEYTSKLSEEVCVTVSSGTWVCEAALWAEWIHVGKLTADAVCTVLAVSSEGLMDVLTRHRTVSHITCLYGHAFCARINTAAPPLSRWPSDLHVPCTDPSDLLAPGVSLGLLAGARQRGELTLSPELWWELHEQIKQERCAIHRVRETGELQRVLFVSVLHLQRQKDDAEEILVQIGKWTEKQGLAPACLLPGTKRRRGEMPGPALQRLLDEDLPPFRDRVNVSHSEEEVEVKECDRFGIQAKYLRTVTCAKLDPLAEQPKLARVCSIGPTRRSIGVPARKSFMPEVAALMDHDVFWLWHGEAAVLYAWLPPQRFKALCLPWGRAVLQAWVGCVELPASGGFRILAEDIQVTRM